MRIFLLSALVIFYSSLYAQQAPPAVVLEENSAIDYQQDILLIDNSKTKAGRDFYEEVYRKWQNALADTTEINIITYLNKISDELIVVIDESPGMGNSTIVSVTVNELLIWRQNLQPKAEWIEILAENAALYITDYIVNYAEYMEQLKSEDENDTY